MAFTQGQLERRIAEEQQSFARPLRSLVERAVVVCAESQTMAQAAAAMRAERVGSVVVVDESGGPIGIVTSHDLVGALADNAGGRPVSERMTRELFTLSADALAYEAALAMTARSIRHVLVTDGGRLLGVVSERDLFSLQRLGVGELTMEIRLAEHLEPLTALAAEIRRLTTRLVHQGVSAEQLTALVSALNDRLSQRVIELVRKRHDLERIRWCWLALGSEGRLEQTFSSDQDNGLVFLSHDDTVPEQVRSRLLPFAREVNEALDACGFPLCKGNIMASNPELCLSLEEWRAKMAGWIASSPPKALLGAVICFDFRPLFGDTSLADDLRGWVQVQTRRHPLFLHHMAQNAVRVPPVLGRLGAFATEDPAGAEGSIDMKAQGARIFVDAARIFALAHGAPQTNTAERLRAVRAALGMSETKISDVVNAFFVVQAVRLRLQADNNEMDEALRNRVFPARLGQLESTVLREALRIARELQERLALDYQL